MDTHVHPVIERKVSYSGCDEGYAIRFDRVSNSTGRILSSRQVAGLTEEDFRAIVDEVNAYFGDPA